MPATQQSLMERTSVTDGDANTTLAPASDVGSLLTLAINQGITPDGLSKLLDLQERILQRQAEAAFNAAMQEFQSRCPPIPHDRDGHQASYASLPRIAEAIAPLLSELGLSYCFDAEFISEESDVGNGKTVERGYIRATCTVHHVEGHSRSARFQSPIDKTSKMNCMQQSASALTYARRYALTLALGLTTTDTDDDGARSGRRPHDAPERDRNAPVAQPRSGRVQQSEVDSLKKRWWEVRGQGLSKPEARDAFCRWAYETAAVPEGRADQLSAWTRDAVRVCESALSMDEQDPFGGSA